MNLNSKLAIVCLMGLIPYFSYTQCFDSKPIETFSGDTVVYSCPGSFKSTVSIRQFTYSIPFVFVVTNEKDTVKFIVNNGLVDFDGLPEGTYKVFGFAYKGPLNKIVGKYLPENRVANFCFTRSSNFITVIRSQPLAPVLGPQSSAPIFVCGPDQKADSITVDALFPSNNMRKYVVVNENDKVVALSNSPVINADPLDCKTCKIYAAGYSGNFLLKNGDNISEPLSDDCYSISKNYITLIHGIPVGGQINFKNGSKDLFICASSNKDQSIEVSLSGNSGGQVKYIFTDSANTILEVSAEPVLSSSTLRAGICKIYALTYTGNISANLPGKRIDQTLLSDDCGALTSNFVLIVKQNPDGGSISYTANQGLKNYCLGDSVRFIQVNKSGVVGPQSTLVLVDDANTIEGVSNDKIFPGKFNKGIHRIYNLSYTGQLVIHNGSLFSDPASDDCYDYSNDFLSFNVDEANAGILAFSDNSSRKFLCANDTASLKLNISQSGFSSFYKAYLISGTSDAGSPYKGWLTNTTLDFTNIPNGIYEISAFSFPEAINFDTTEFFIENQLADQICQANSNKLIIEKGQAKAGFSQFDNNKDTLSICSENLSKIYLKQIQASSPNYKHLVVNDAGIIVSIEQDSIDPVNLKNGVYSIKQIAFVDSVDIKVGDHVNQIQLEKSCGQISSHTLTLIKDQAIGGSIHLANGDTAYQACIKDGWADILSIVNTSQSIFLYTYVATDTFGQIVAINIERANIELLPSQAQRVYGVSYLGDFMGKVGDSIFIKNLASSCFSISSNFISLSSNEVVAGNIRTDSNESVFNYCLESKTVDTISLKSNGASANSKYVYIGIQDDVLKFISTTGILISNLLPTGATQIFGIAYNGNFIAQPGDKISQARIVDSCFGVSTNSILINRSSPEAGKITASNGSGSIYLCPGDNQPDFINFSTIEAGPLEYAYIITNMADSIIGISKTALIDFDGYPLGTCKVYGISYKGDLDTQGKKLNAADIASECFDITDSPIFVIKSEADAGHISLANGDSAIAFCVEDLAPDTLQFKTTSLVQLNYALLVTNSQNRLQFVYENAKGTIDFNGYDLGQYKVYGVSYGGVLSVFRNDDVTKVNLASGCFDLSDNYVALNLSNTGGLCKNIGVSKENPAFISIYPNPAQNVFKVRLKPSILKHGRPELVLVSASGGVNQKIILDSQVLVNQEVEINTSSLTPGLYFLLFKNGYIFDKIKVVIVK
ncbi:MAG: T9SS type A sorting domain-containing protein [Saprospiraceae bacterium]